MLTKTEFIAALARESAIAKHLASKLQPDHLGFRLTPAQRSTAELLQYYATFMAGTVAYFVSGNFDAWDGYEAANVGVTPASFGEALDRQLAEVTRLLTPVGDAEFATRASKDFAGNPAPLVTLLTDLTLSFAIGYKMQLFLQAKAAGLSTLGTPNLWFGVDPKPKA